MEPAVGVEIGLTVRTLGVSREPEEAVLSTFSFAALFEGEPMSLTDRVFGAFEAEFVKHLAFSFTLVRRAGSARSPMHGPCSISELSGYSGPH